MQVLLHNKNEKGLGHYGETVKIAESGYTTERVRTGTGSEPNEQPSFY